MSVQRGTKLRRSLEGFFGVGVRQQTYKNLLYLALAFPLGLAYFVFVTVGVSLGLGLSVVLVGLPILALVVAAALGVAQFERALANYCLDTDMAGKPMPSDGSLRDRVVGVATDSSTWLTVLYLPSKFVIGLASFVLMVTALSTGVSMLLVPFYYGDTGLYVGVVTDRPVELHPTLYVAWNKLLVGVEAVVRLDAWYVSTLDDAVLVALLGVFVLLVGLHTLNLVARFSARVTTVLIGDAYDVVGPFEGEKTK